ncbi:hypothetical protein ABPG75_004239 [Micractinium tetrahymenae]
MSASGTPRAPCLPAHQAASSCHTAAAVLCPAELLAAASAAAQRCKLAAYSATTAAAGRGAWAGRAGRQASAAPALKVLSNPCSKLVTEALAAPAAGWPALMAGCIKPSGACCRAGAKSSSKCSVWLAEACPAAGAETDSSCSSLCWQSAAWAEGAAADGQFSSCTKPATGLMAELLCKRRDVGGQ